MPRKSAKNGWKKRGKKLCKMIPGAEWPTQRRCLCKFPDGGVRFQKRHVCRQRARRRKQRK